MVSERRRDSVGGGSSRIFTMHFPLMGPFYIFGIFKREAPFFIFGIFKRGDPLLHFWDCQKGGPGPPGPPLNRPLLCSYYNNPVNVGITYIPSADLYYRLVEYYSMSTVN